MKWRVTLGLRYTGENVTKVFSLRRIGCTETGCDDDAMLINRQLRTSPATMKSLIPYGNNETKVKYCNLTSRTHKISRFSSHRPIRLRQHRFPWHQLHLDRLGIHHRQLEILPSSPRPALIM